uniref:cyclophane-forming radical SAM/SPASM peptide maturase GrrM/OscB n=1 Tax=Herbidospora sakaeratensis TaxID=564415 RepID=UPI0007C743B7|nr:cyclophane-forming radical SAM/SPASM peptide maturase GrrM/OscB [Herbidospora sakaeratensis]
MLRQVIMQPTSSCNLNCTYCYVPNRRDRTLMSPEVLDHAIRKTLRSDLVRGRVEFLWHAGEPLMAGRQFYVDAMRSVATHNHRGIEVRQSLQTNGTLVTRDWCAFLQEHGFSVGLSVDGPAAIHDRSRRNWSGGRSHEKVMRGYELLTGHGIPLGAICVLTRESLRHPDEIFAFFLGNGFTSVGFNVEEVENGNTSSSLTERGGEVAGEYRRFMDRIYDLWRAEAGRLSVREFGDLSWIIRHKFSDPGYQRRPLETQPLGIITIQKDGTISTFSPEFAGAKSPEYGDFSIGNILDVDELDDVQDDANLRRIVQAVDAGIQACADECLFFDLCGGAYTSNKFFENGSLTSTETTACRLHRQELSAVLIEKLSRR